MPRTKARNTIFTPAMDDLLREMYPTVGGKATLKALNERFNASYAMHQLHSRCRVLGLSASPKNVPKEPAFPSQNPDKDFVGPVCYRSAYYLILRYIGYIQPDPLISGHHKYQCRCSRCGSNYERTQTALLAAKRKNSEGCYKCSNEIKVKLQRQNAKAQAKESEQVEEITGEWWHWPPISMDLVPENKLFDTQRVVRLHEQKLRVA